MQENYTRKISDRCFDVADRGILTVWDDIENTSEDTNAEAWKKKLEQIAQHFALSSRFALARILCARAAGTQLDDAPPAEGFSLTVGDSVYAFGDISSEYIASMDSEELARYEQALMSVASNRPNDDPAVSRRLILRALRDSDAFFANAMSQSVDGAAGAGVSGKKESALRKESKTLLTRREAMQLGHALGLSVQEMSWFLLRVFDFEDGFRYRSSDDLIDAYGFLTGAGVQEVEKLRERFASMRRDVEPAAEYVPIPNWTKTVGITFPYRVETWAADPKTQEQSFLRWLLQQAPQLDQPSRTATRAYRRLAAYTAHLAADASPDDADAFFDGLQHLCEDSESIDPALCDEKGDLSAKACGKVSALLLERNKELFTAAPDRARAWRTVTVSEAGLPRLIMAGRPDAGRNRVQELLHGTEQVEKGDMLHMLWFAFNLFWLRHPIATSNDIFNALADFTDAAEMLLNAALLPPFYPPHIMEQSMMLSIVLCSEETGVPADKYAEICESLILPRNRKK